MRLQKYLALCGLGSRRKMEEDIASGHVKVNGQVVVAMGTQVEPGTDRVEYKGRVVLPEEEKVYILMHKPEGTVTTVQDEKQRKTVLDLISLPQRVYPVGRLDYNTSGLLILTNDGDFAYQMTHPKHEIFKTYLARVEGVLHPKDWAPMERGMTVKGVAYRPAQVDLVETNKQSTLLKITIGEGKNRQVRNMCEGIGHPVLELRRISIGSVTLGNLNPGQWRKMSPDEVTLLKEMGI